MPRAKQACKRCDSAVPGEHERSCRYFRPTAEQKQAWEREHERHRLGVLSIVDSPKPSLKMRKRVFTIDHADGSETTITVAGPAGAVRCNSTEQSVQVWTGENAPQQINAPQPLGRLPIVAHSTDVSRSGQEYTVTDALDDVPGGNMGLTEEELNDPNVVLERMRRGMIGRMSSETSSSDVLLIPEGN